MSKSIRGKHVDFHKLRSANPSLRAVGTANRNARGDLVSSSGQVLQTREQQAQSYNKTPPNAVKHVDINAELESVFAKTQSAAVAPAVPTNTSDVKKS